MSFNPQYGVTVEVVPAGTIIEGSPDWKAAWKLYCESTAGAISAADDWNQLSQPTQKRLLNETLERRRVDDDHAVIKGDTIFVTQKHWDALKEAIPTTREVHTL